MSKNDPKSLSCIIGQQDSLVGQLAQAAARRRLLADHLRAGLGPELATGFRHCNLREDGTLMILASSPEWAARLRFEGDKLLQLARTAGWESACAVKIGVAQAGQP